MFRTLVVMLLLGVASPGWCQDVAEEEPAARILEPGEATPPYVQLSPTESPVIWDPQQVGEFQLVDQDGNPVTRESLLGTPWVANFIFARCVTHCPLTCRKIMELNEELSKVPVRFVTITVDPEHDTPEFMKEFAETWKATPDRWLFCTGKPDEVWHLIRHGFKDPAWENVGTARRPGMEFAHSNHLIHVDQDGVIQGRYNSGIDYELVILKEVLQGKKKTPDQFRPARPEKPAAKEVDPMSRLPDWAKRLPQTNASLNTLATFLLIWGLMAVKAGAFRLHKRLMLGAFFVSILFLGCYLTYHWALHEYAGVRGKPFPYTGPIAWVYYSILITHVFLAAAVPVLAIGTIRSGLKAYPRGVTFEQFQQRSAERLRHRRWAKVTFPIWLYVSVTGVVIYIMLYRM